jgi:hypothetical protein
MTDKLDSPKTEASVETVFLHFILFDIFGFLAYLYIFDLADIGLIFYISLILAGLISVRVRLVVSHENRDDSIIFSKVCFFRIGREEAMREAERIANLINEDSA